MVKDSNITSNKNQFLNQSFCSTFGNGNG